MKKPKPVQRKPVLIFYNMINYINKKYNINIRDYANKNENKGKYCNGDYPIVAWCKKHGYDYTVLEESYKYPYEDPKVLKIINERVRLNELFSNAIDRYEFERPYLDYWHFLLNNPFTVENNPTEEYWNLREIIENEENEDWIIEITKLFYEEFKEYLDEDGGLNVLISW